MFISSPETLMIPGLRPWGPRPVLPLGQRQQILLPQIWLPPPFPSQTLSPSLLRMRPALSDSQQMFASNALGSVVQSDVHSYLTENEQAPAHRGNERRLARSLLQTPLFSSGQRSKKMLCVLGEQGQAQAVGGLDGYPRPRPPAGVPGTWRRERQSRAGRLSAHR